MLGIVLWFGVGKGDDMVEGLGQEARIRVRFRFKCRVTIVMVRVMVRFQYEG